MLPPVLLSLPGSLQGGLGQLQKLPSEQSLTSDPSAFMELLAGLTDASAGLPMAAMPVPLVTTDLPPAANAAGNILPLPVAGNAPLDAPTMPARPAAAGTIVALLTEQNSAAIHPAAIGLAARSDAALRAVDATPGQAVTQAAADRPLDLAAQRPEAPMPDYFQSLRGKPTAGELTVSIPDSQAATTDSSTAAISDSSTAAPSAGATSHNYINAAIHRGPGTGMATIHIPQGLQAPDWGENFASRVSLTASQQVKHAQLFLNPPELGPMEVRISIANNEANISFTTQHASVRDAVEQALPRLRELMIGQGIDQLNVDVSNQEMQHQSGEQGWPDQAAGQSALRQAQTLSAYGSDETMDGVQHTSVQLQGLIDAYA